MVNLERRKGDGTATVAYSKSCDQHEGLMAEIVRVSQSVVYIRDEIKRINDEVEAHEVKSNELFYYTDERLDKIREEMISATKRIEADCSQIQKDFHQALNFVKGASWLVGVVCAIAVLLFSDVLSLVRALH
jgi:predicted  nucleic acid-binding Zn-ribbon protein